MKEEATKLKNQDKQDYPEKLGGTTKILREHDRTR
jgi:hypothetical protein